MVPDQFYTGNQNLHRQFNIPATRLVENRQAPLTSYSGIAVASQVAEKLGVADVIDERLRLLKRHKPYQESDHILTIVYNLLTGGESMMDIERLQGQEGLKKILGTASIPDPTTTGDFLARFKESDLQDLQQAMADLQQRAFGKLDSHRRQRASIDFDSSIHEVYGEKKEGADFSYDGRWSYHVLYGTLAETGEVLHQELREGNKTSSSGTAEALPGILERVQQSFQQLRFRSDSGFYDKEIVRICEENQTEFFIVAKQTQALMRRVLAIADEQWKSLRRQKIAGSPGKKKAKKRKKRRNRKRAITIRRKPDSEFRGRTQVSSFSYQPTGWAREYRFVVTRTEIVDKENKQLLLQEDLCRYIYHVIVTNTAYSNSAVISIADGRSNQENLIKDFKYGMGLSHVPTGRLMANKAYFLIAALAWNLKTWMVNLLKLADGARLRFKRFLYLWIYHPSVVSQAGTNRVQLRMDPGEYFRRFRQAIERLALL